MKIKNGMISVTWENNFIHAYANVYYYKHCL